MNIYVFETTIEKWGH